MTYHIHLHQNHLVLVKKTKTKQKSPGTIQITKLEFMDMGLSF